MSYRSITMMNDDEIPITGDQTSGLFESCTRKLVETKLVACLNHALAKSFPLHNSLITYGMSLKASGHFTKEKENSMNLQQHQPM